MSKECHVCGKTSIKAHKISFSHKAHVYRQNPNLQTIKVRFSNGTVKRVKVCTSCIRANKVQKAI